MLDIILIGFNTDLHRYIVIITEEHMADIINSM